jgi:hypothetical protein
VLRNEVVWISSFEERFRIDPSAFVSARQNAEGPDCLQSARTSDERAFTFVHDQKAYTGRLCKQDGFAFAVIQSIQGLFAGGRR